MSKIFNNKIIWFNYEPGAGGDFLLGTLFNLPETDTVFKEYNKYGSFYRDHTIEELPFYSISNVNTTNEVNKVKEYINNTKLSYISSHTPPTLIYPLLENPKKLLNVFIYADSLTIERYISIILGIKHDATETFRPDYVVKIRSASWYRKIMNDIITGGFNVSARLHEHRTTLPISYCSLFINREPEVLKKLIDIYNAEITVEEFDLKIKEYHNKNLELIKNENDKYTL
jgi:hypothetical protein